MARPASWIVIVLASAFIAACSPPDPHESSTEQLAVTVSPTGCDFGSYQVGQTSPPCTLTVSPATLGASYDTINTITESCPDFSVDAPGLPYDVYRTCETCPTCAAGQICPAIACCTSDYQTYSFTTSFKPTVAASVSCVVNINLASGITKTVTLNGTGTPPPKKLTVQPGSLSFGDVRRNTDSNAIPLTISNSGGQTMTVSGVSISGGYQIASGQTSAYQLGAGASVNYSIVCHPTTTGQQGGAITITSDDPMTPTKSIPLQCNGIDSALSISPSPTTLATTRVGEPVDADIQLTNSGTASMSFEGVSLTGTDLQMTTTPTTGAIGPGQSKTARVHFTAANAGTVSGTLTVTYDGGQQRTSAISARALATSMAVTPDGDVDFGPVCAGQTKSQTFSILANDEGSFKLSSIAGAAAPFTVTAPALPKNVAGSGATTVSFDVTAAPTDAGMQTSSVTITTDMPADATRTINLSVEGLPAGVSATPAAGIDFGSTMLMTTTIGQRVNLTNCSADAITTMNAHIEGPDAAQFAIVAMPENSSIMSTGTATWLVVMSAQVGGLLHAEFVVDYDGGQARIPLDGEGLTDGGTGTDPGSTIDEKSYYTCSTAGSSGFVWPSFVVAFLVWRRRRRRC